MRSDQIKLSGGKLRAAILHVVEKCEPDRLGAVKLHKVLYYSDMLTFIDTGSALTGAEYRKRTFGPTCDAALRAISEMQLDGAISVKTVDYFGYQKKEFALGRKVETNLLSVREKELLEEMIRFVCYDNSAKSISDLSHDMIWQMVDFGEVIPYHSAIHLVPSVVDIETLEWAEAEGDNVARQRVAAQRSPSMESGNTAAFRSRMVANMGKI